MSFWINTRAWQCLLIISCITLYVGVTFQRAAPSVTQPAASYTSQSGSASVANGAPSAASAPAIPVSDLPDAQTLPSGDQTFNFSVTTVLSPLKKDAEIHVVTTQKGDDGKKDTIWWEKCQEEDSKLSPVECHRKWAGYRETNPVRVNVYPSKQIVLVLIAYEPVVWKINTQNADRIQKIILGGYHSQEVVGIPSSVPVEVGTYKASPSCHSCSLRPTLNYVSDSENGAVAKKNNLIASLESETGLPVVTYQSAHTLSNVTISDYSKRRPRKSTKKKSGLTEDKFIDQKYETTYRIANTELPLPDGVWKGLVLQDVKTNLGSDNALVFYQAYNGVLNSLYAVRLKHSGDGSGFPQKLSCKNNLGYISKSDQNQNFGIQDCYWLEHVTDPWLKPVFQLSMERLRLRDVEVPEVIINAGFHRADKDMSLTSYLYTNPEVAGIDTQTSSWGASPWHPRKLAADQRRADFIKDQEQWIKSWYGVMKLADLSF